MTAPELGFSPTSIRLIGDLWHEPDRLVAISETDGTTAWYIDVNPAARRILGYSREEILAMRPGDLLENPDAAGPMLGQLVDGRRIRAIVKLRHKDGHLVTADIWVYRTRIATRDLNITISHPIA